LARKLASSKCGYFSDKDRLLIRDAVMLECHAFLTMDNKLARNAVHIEKELGLKVLSSSGYWKLYSLGLLYIHEWWANQDLEPMASSVVSVLGDGRESVLPVAWP
jgi:hypothetical protein